MNRPRQASAAWYRKQLAKRGDNDGMRWYLLIKALRTEHGFDLDAAHREALRDPVWRRWLERRINGDPQCAKQARQHMRLHGKEALIVEDGDVLRVRAVDPDGWS